MVKRKSSESVEDDWYKPEESVVHDEVVPSDPDDFRPLVSGDDGWVYVLPSKNQKKRCKAACTLQAFIRRQTYEIRMAVNVSHMATRKM